MTKLGSDNHFDKHVELLEEQYIDKEIEVPEMFQKESSNSPNRSPRTVEMHQVFLFLIFVSCHAGFFPVFPILLPLPPLHLEFECLRHRNEFANKSVLNENSSLLQ